MKRKTKTAREIAYFDRYPSPDTLWKRIQETDLPLLLEVDEAFVAARAIHEGDPYVRFELESRILANQTPAEIANRMLIPAEVVTEYEDYFFDVRGRLHMTSWIAREAIQRHPSGLLHAKDVGPFWRWIGFHFGVGPLERTLGSLHVEVLRDKGLDAYWQAGTEIDVDLKLLVLIERFPMPRTQSELISWFEIQEEILSLRRPPNEDLLSPLQLELHLFDETEDEVLEIGEGRRGSRHGAQVVRMLKTIFNVKRQPVGQTNAA